MKLLLPGLLLLASSLSSCVVMENAATQLKPVGKNIRSGLVEFGERSQQGFARLESRLEQRSKERRQFNTGRPSSIWSGIGAGTSQRQTYASNRSSSSSSRSSSSSSSSRSTPKPPVKKPAASGWSAGSTPVSSNRSSGTASTNSSKASKPASSAPKMNNLPFAVAVPGRSGYVKLPNRDLPDIDVRGIPPGTPVEVQDPERTGETIQFKVP